MLCHGQSAGLGLEGAGPSDCRRQEKHREALAEKDQAMPSFFSFESLRGAQAREMGRLRLQDNIAAYDE